MNEIARPAVASRRLIQMDLFFGQGHRDGVLGHFSLTKNRMPAC